VDFVAIVDQAIALLRQRGRLTYRTLQVQFQLDAEHLEVLTDELIKGQRLAIDEDGAVLVWIGDAAATVSGDLKLHQYRRFENGRFSSWHP
jgi:hypothetical protein